MRIWLLLERPHNWWSRVTNMKERLTDLKRNAFLTNGLWIRQLSSDTVPHDQSV